MRSTFVINFSAYEVGDVCGRARHVGSGEEAAFHSLEGLLDFFRDMNDRCALERELDEVIDQWAEPPSHRDDDRKQESLRGDGTSVPPPGRDR